MGFSIIMTSVKGEKTVNQDAIRTFEDENFVVMALADGLGSAPMSEYGSRAICRTVIRCIKKAVRTTSSMNLDIIVDDWKTALQKAGLKPSDCLTTSSFVLINKKERRVTSAQIGDSQIYIATDDVFFTTSSEKDFSNITECIGDNNRSKFSIRSLHYREKVRILIASDGISDELEHSRVLDLMEYLSDYYQKIPSKKRNVTLSWDVKRTFSRLNSDDKSMIFLWN